MQIRNIQAPLESCRYRQSGTFIGPGRLLDLLFLGLVLLLLNNPPVEAQSNLKGKVTDPQKEPIAGAKITIRPLLSDVNRTVVETDAEGKYQLENFNLARAYRFTVEKDGFRLQVRDVEVGLGGTIAGSTMVEDFTLYPVGSERSKEESKLIMMLRRSPGQEQYKRGVRSLENGDLKKAKTRLERSRELDPELAPTHEMLAVVYHKLGDNEAALRAADRALTLIPGEADFLRIRYDALKGLGRKEEARETLVQLDQASFNPSNATLFYNEGVSAVLYEDWPLAEAMFQAALQLDPNLTKATEAIAKVYNSSRKFESALVAVQEALKTNPKDLDLWRIRQEAYAALGRQEEAMQALQELARRDPSPRTATLLYNQGVSAFNHGDNETAERIFLQALEIQPRQLESQIGLAEVYLRTKRYDLCLKTTEKILAQEPDNSTAARIQEWARNRQGLNKSD